MVKFLVDLMESGKVTTSLLICQPILIYFFQFQEPENDIVSLSGSDDDIGAQVREAITRLAAGGVGKKLLLRFQD